jgi:PiT family inorganic phosphate transporter
MEFVCKLLQSDDSHGARDSVILGAMGHYFGSLDTMRVVFLVLALGLAFGFEFVNGFHDTANAVATVIYTHSLPPYVAVVWSGMWNLIGVLTSTGAVAFGVVSLLPVELVMNVGSGAGFAMVFSLLISAIVWNLGTWYLGLPASSSHTLFGSIMGVGLMNSIMNSGGLLGGVNWAQAKNIGMSLLISPIVGFVCTALLFLLIKALIKNPPLYSEPDPKKAPPLWIRAILCLTCTGVSFAHGSNDGQKGMGLIMLILIGIVPGVYALNLAPAPGTFDTLAAQSHSIAAIIEKQAAGAAVDAATASKTLGAYLKSGGTFSNEVFPALAEKNREITAMLDGHKSMGDLPENERGALRTSLYYTAETISKLKKTKMLASKTDEAALGTYETSIEKETKFIPIWVKVAVAVSLGLGTMIGWKRIVVTVGEKIGKSHLTYAQGASAELVAMITILLADKYGLPVSTTHVLSSGVAGSMAANHSGLQMNTLRNLLLAWVLTLPVCVFLGAMFFASGLLILSRLFGLH